MIKGSHKQCTPNLSLKYNVQSSHHNTTLHSCCLVIHLLFGWCINDVDPYPKWTGHKKLNILVENLFPTKKKNQQKDNRVLLRQLDSRKEKSSLESGINSKYLITGLQHFKPHRTVPNHHYKRWFSTPALWGLRACGYLAKQRPRSLLICPSFDLAAISNTVLILSHWQAAFQVHGLWVHSSLACTKQTISPRPPDVRFPKRHSQTWQRN